MLVQHPTKVLIKVSLYFTLFALFCYFYLLEEVDNYFKGRNTVTSRAEEATVLEPPTFTLCVDPPLKMSVAKRYNFTDNRDLFYKDVANKSIAEKFTELSYKLNRDYEIKIGKVYLF